MIARQSVQNQNESTMIKNFELALCQHFYIYTAIYFVLMSKYGLIFNNRPPANLRQELIIANCGDEI